SLHSAIKSLPNASRQLLIGSGSETTEATKAVSRVPRLLRLPAPAQRRVELNHGEQLVQTGLRQAQLRREVVGLAGQDFEIARGPSPVANVGEARGILRRRREQSLALAELARLSVTHEGVGDVAEGLLDRLPIAVDELLGLRLRQSDAGLEAAGGEDRLNQASGHTPESSRTGEQTGEREALQPAAPRQADGREVGRLGHPDLRVR